VECRIESECRGEASDTRNGTLAYNTAKEYPVEVDVIQLFCQGLTRGQSRIQISTTSSYSVACTFGCQSSVIVGPGIRQEERAERARSLVGNIPVTMLRCI